MAASGRSTVPAILWVEDVSVTFSGRREPLVALRDVSFQVSSGEFVCVVGPSGCGKSTLLNLVAGFEKPDGGRVLFQGEPVSGPDAGRGVVFQRPALYPWLSVWKNITFGPRMRGVSARERNARCEHFLRMVRLEEYRDLAPDALSGGMRQRVALARVLANNPEMVLLDEPLGALDALTRAHLQSELLRIWSETNKTFFMITHDVEEALFLATTILVMSPRPGHIVKTFSPRFSRAMAGEGRQSLKASPDFIRLREAVMEEIYTERVEKEPSLAKLSSV